jgi:NodT family efflux transporter outer membrane factor (OMF) lipoprotein
MLLLCACSSVGPDYAPPDTPWLGDWAARERTEAVAHPQTTARADAEDWWRHFNDPALDALVAEAQRLNPGVRTAGLRIMEARARLGIAGSALYPQVQQVSGEVVRAGQQRSEESDTSFGSYRAGFEVFWELDFWGKFRRGVEAADYDYLATIARYDDVQVLVAAQVAELYSRIRTVELRLAIARENAALQKRSLEITERRFRSGNDTELDVQQAKTLYISTLAIIPELEAALRQAQNALGVLLGRPPGPLPEMAAGTGTIPAAPDALIIDVPADLLRRRPDVRAVELQLAAQSALIGLSEAELYPSISLLGSVGLSSTSLDWSSRTLDWGAGGGLVWNVFDHGRLKNQVPVQDARFEQLHEQYQEAVFRAAREVDDAAVAFARNRLQVALLEESGIAARRSLEIATVQYREGLVDFQRVLDSQRSLFSQQDRLATNRGNVAQSLVSLYKAMGGGWQPARARPVLDETMRETMRERSAWKSLLDAPLPAAETPAQSPAEDTGSR